MAANDTRRCGIRRPSAGCRRRSLPDNGWIAATLPLARLFVIGVGIGKLILNSNARAASAYALF
jgi:hypothetical protein